MAANKNHHYVPQMLMRQFSNDKKSISLFVLDQDKEVLCASIRKQCYEEHFYGKEGSIEKAFSELEGQVASIIKDLDAARCESLSDDDVRTLRSFIHFQTHRTVQAANQLSESMNKTLKKVAQELPDMKDIDFNMFDIRITDPQHRLLKTAAELVLLTTDLEVKFLLNEREIDFILSDHPVVRCNPFAEFHPKFGSYPSSCGLSSKGLMMLMPLSPRLAVVFFDKDTYSIGSNGKRTCGLSKKDVLAFNSLQIAVTNKTVYANTFAKCGLSLEEIKRIKNERNPYMPLVEEYGQSQKLGQKTNKLIVTHFPSPKVGIKFSFLKITDTHNYRQYNKAVLPVRSQELLDYSKQFVDELKKKNPYSG